MFPVIDSHVHVGRFRSEYFDPVEVGRFLLRQGVTGCVASATIAAIGKHKKAICDLESLMTVPGLTVWPLLWVTPGLMAKYPDLEEPLCQLPYHGLKIHTHANRWSNAMLEQVFCIAEEKGLGILLHTGVDDCCSPERFRKFCLRHPDAKVVLAHGRPIHQAIEVLRDCPNVFVDTAFMPIPHIKMLIKVGFHTRIIFGSDTPIDRCYYSGSPSQRYKGKRCAIQSAVGKENLESTMVSNSHHVFGVQEGCN